MMRYQLVLDVAGVIISNLSPSYWDELAKSTSISSEKLRTQFKQEIREILWTGKINEIEFWEWLKKKSPSIEIHHAQRILFKHLKCLPAFNCIPDWSRFADIHLLSNHRKEWIEPLIDPIMPFIKSITISSEVGFCKPRPEIYEIVNSKLETNLQVMFIDDQEKNMKPAKALSWNTLIADKPGKWIEQVQLLLINN